MTDDPRRIAVPSLMSPDAPPYSPACRKLCRGTDRPVWTPPVKGYKTPDGVKHLVCDCCDKELERIAAGIADAPNIAPGIDQTGRKRYFCTGCGFEVVTIPELKPV